MKLNNRMRESCFLNYKKYLTERDENDTTVGSFNLTLVPSDPDR